MNEDNRASRERRNSNKDRWNFVATLLENFFVPLEDFAERLIGRASESADSLVNRSLQKTFVLVLIGIGTAMFLAGGATVADSMFGLPGIGHMLIGTVILLAAAISYLLIRKPGR